VSPPVPPQGTGPAATTAAVAGLLAAALAVGLGELTAGLLGVTSPVLAIGEGVIALAPPRLVEVVIATFGGLNRTALVTGTVIVLAALSMPIGLAWRRDRRIGALAVGALGVVGLAAQLAHGVDTLPAAAAPALVATLGGLTALWAALPPGARPGTRSGPREPGRRAFLRTAGVLTLSAVSAGAVGRWLQQRATAVAERLELALRPPDVPADPLPEGADLGLDGLSPFVTPNEEFFRIDTALRPPSVRAEDWRLRVHGLVEREMELTYDDLVARELVEADVTLTCVSNEVGGDLVGNARWLGARLDEVLAEVGVRKDASQLVARSVDGYTGGFPVTDALDGRNALLAVGMNGEPLPLIHGYPVRLVVPGLYGYVSAVKWLAELELTTFESFDQYWVRRGWAERAPVKLQSRIDRPRAGARLPAGEIVVAGIAWAQTRGIERVEVQVDEGPWTDAELATTPGPDTWRQWWHRASLAPGTRRLRARATAGGGEVQPGAARDPVPDGAEGWHTIEVRIDG
jgi:DMSO/TMAO reductase YedYZ molybdopterin-dependent catalytic subunit